MDLHDTVIPLDLLRARRADKMTGAERAQFRASLSDFAIYRDRCPTARRETSEIATSNNSGPLSGSELSALRTMLLEFEAIKSSCPTARLLLEG